MKGFFFFYNRVFTGLFGSLPIWSGTSRDARSENLARQVGDAFKASPPKLRVCTVFLLRPSISVRVHPYVLGAFAKLRKMSISVVRSVRPSVRPPAWNVSAATGRIFMAVDIWAFFEKSVEKIQVSLKPDQHNGHFTWRPVYFCGISLNSS